MKKILMLLLIVSAFVFPSAVLAQDNTNPPSETVGLKTYQNYDFVPGDKILFEDNFADDQDGEFPAHWELKGGQAILNKVPTGGEGFFLTDGNYAVVTPRMKTPNYLAEPFTVEYDFFAANEGSSGLITDFKTKTEGEEVPVYISFSEANVTPVGMNAITKGSAGQDWTENFRNKWHHIAIACKNHQMKVYIDQNRILVIPDTHADFVNLVFEGIGETDHPIIFKNIRIALGGQMNMIGKKFTEAKIVTHGINFDIDKAGIKPESMGTLNMIVQVMKDNPDIKFEVDGHTDNSGTPAHNLALSQQRANAVKDQLVKMGVDASRLTAKGLGDTKPVDNNATLEGKANNRRVEFVKI
ncbi:MAG TPA: OmpA family protein [Mucilaginibacter sp.]|jgi:outer membrane protein OmpA-like peptidoglycan-associated protein|nr:OmpA family protein [Mucilaginibacter sp.]